MYLETVSFSKQGKQIPFLPAELQTGRRSVLLKSTEVMGELLKHNYKSKREKERDKDLAGRQNN